MTFELKHFKHTEGKGIYALSKPASVRRDAQLAADMAAWLADQNGKFGGEFAHAYAIGHCQVADEPVQLFVVAPPMLGKGDGKHTQKNFYFPAAAIFNARILEAPGQIEKVVPNRVIYKNPETKRDEMRIEPQKRMISNKAPMAEGCMSFPNRTEKNVERFFRIKVRYWYNWHGIPMRRTEWVEGLKAHIFQHEIDHFNGKNIFFK